MNYTMRGLLVLAGISLAGWPIAAGAQVAAPPTTQQPRPPAAATPAVPLPKVVLFATGGTISNKDGGRLTVDELIASLTNLPRYVRAEGVQFANTASSAMTLEQWLDL